MKVLHVTPSFYPALVYGGPTQSVYHLCRGLVRQGCDVRVLTTNANGRDAVLDVETGREVRVAEALPVRYCQRVAGESISPMLLRLLHARIRWADVVHLMAVYSFPTIPTLLASSMLGKPVVWSPRGMLQRWQGTTRPFLKSIWERICRVVAPERMILHVTSDAEAEACVKRLPGAQTVVVPNSFEMPANVAPRTDRGPLRLLYLGRLHPIKGIENLLLAYGMLNGDLGKDCSLIIAGAGEVSYTEGLKKQVEQLTPSHPVKMVGAVTGEDKRRLFEHADVVIVPSHTENFGMVVAEALAHEVPVIASHGTPWQRLPEMGCGLWVDNQPGSLAKAIKEISRMPLREMGQKGRAWMRKEFTDDVVAEKMLTVYESLIARTTQRTKP